MTHPDHSKHCHCVCTDLYELQAAIEQARAIHIRHEPAKDKCLICGSFNEACDNCKFLKNCVACNEVWPCDTFIALDIQP